MYDGAYCALTNIAHHIRASQSVLVHHTELEKEIEKMVEFQAKYKFESDKNENRKAINNLPKLLCSEKAWFLH